MITRGGVNEVVATRACIVGYVGRQSDEVGQEGSRLVQGQRAPCNPYTVGIVGVTALKRKSVRTQGVLRLNRRG